jgi:hypothetical protein
LRATRFVIFCRNFLIVSGDFSFRCCCCLFADGAGVLPVIVTSLLESESFEFSSSSFSSFSSIAWLGGIASTSISGAIGAIGLSFFAMTSSKSGSFGH